MSHSHERKEKICLNCDAELHGRYCHRCGQENVEPKESFWHLVTHFVYDVTHFDGKFFSTVKYLLLRPGFLSAEYIKGKRASYLNPIKMYVFTSAFFFVFFFSVVMPEDKFNVKDSKKSYTYKAAVEEIREEREEIEVAIRDTSISAKKKIRLQTKLQQLEADSLRLLKDTTNLSQLNVYATNDAPFGKDEYSNLAEYDSAQKKLPPNERDNWIEKQIRLKKIEWKGKYGNDTKAIMSALLKKFFHFFPQVLFVSLPLIALVLKLLYIRRKQFYYVDHVIYCVHLYCAMFIMMFLEIIFSRIQNIPHLKWVSYIALFFLFYMLWYIYKSMRNFYRQRRGKTILKYLLLMFISFFILNILVAFYFLFSAYTI